jgi:hypothetical protein
MYSKNGSIPKPETDVTDGWIEVPDEPECPAGKEVVWWYPPGWVIRDPKPEGNWSWSQSQEQWVEYIPPQEVVLTTDSLPAITSADFGSIASSDLQAL